MIKKLKFIHYRKLKDIELFFSRGVNIISGTNGTCKTSILHIISNSFKQPKSISAIKTLKSLNASVNPKIETLTRGDKRYANPAIGTSGTLYKAQYYEGGTLEFRRKNDKKLEESKKRFRIIPKYMRGSREALPDIPVIYLGLSRLISIGEIDDDNFRTHRNSLPVEYHYEIAKLYEELTNQKINVDTYKTIGYESIKTRADFLTEEEGIDSNTISDGQDNIHMILTALISLKYYYEETKSHKKGGSILLIDEVDATLHPDLQLKLLEILKKFSEKYKIQVVVTTHSLDILEKGLKHDYYNVIYLDDDIEKVKVLKDEQLDIYNIKCRLYLKTMGDLMRDKYIPVYTEDNEARQFLEIILDYFSEKKEEFSKVRNYFYMAESCLGYGNLEKLFKDKKCDKQFKNCIGVVDGDVKLNKGSINSNLLELPGKTSVEKLAFEFSEKLYNENPSEFWDDNYVVESGFTRNYYINNIKKQINNIKSNLKRKEREENKKCFNKQNNNEFFRCVLKYWVLIPDNQRSLEYFYKGLITLYYKTAELNGINRKLLKEPVNKDN